MRLREKLKTFTGADGLENIDSNRPSDPSSAPSKGAVARKDYDLLRLHNQQLLVKLERYQKRYNDEDDGGGEDRPTDLEGDMQIADTSTLLHSSKKRKSVGYVLGDDDNLQGLSAGAGVEEYRAHMQRKWENEKRLQKRYGPLPVIVYSISLVYINNDLSGYVFIFICMLSHRLTVVEGRLKEKVSENQDLLGQLKHARDAAQAAMVNKDELNRRVTAAAKLTQEARRLTTDDIFAIEEVRACNLM